MDKLRKQSYKLGVLLVICAIFIGFTSLSDSKLARLVHFDWSYTHLSARGSRPPGSAPFWYSQEKWENVLQKRGFFVIRDKYGSLHVEDAATVQEYMQFALEIYSSVLTEFEPPALNGYEISVAHFSSLLDTFLHWENGLTLTVTEYAERHYANSPSIAPNNGITKAPRRKLDETTSTSEPEEEGVSKPAPDSTTRITTTPIPTTTEIPTTPEEIVYPDYYDSCDWSTRPNPPACDNGWNACQDPQCDGTSAEVQHKPVCACTDDEMLAQTCIFFQCDTDGDGTTDTCLTDTNGDESIDQADDDCGVKDENGVGIPNSMEVCTEYVDVCSPFQCYCSQNCKQFNDCCEDFDDHCAVCSCGPYAEECCCQIGEYNADCNGLVDYCNCVACTCVPGEYFYSDSVSDTCLSRSCEPAACAAGEYFANCECGSGTVSDAPGDCTSCITTCSVGQYMNGTCDGTTIVDVKSCLDCTGSGECPDKYYYDGTNCQGDGTTDDTCIACTASGSCTVGEFFDATQCLGDGFSDTTCQLCTTTGNCAIGFYFENSNCQGDTETDDSCVLCTTSGNCPIRSYFEATNCQGDTETDDSCVACTSLGACADNFFWDSNQCLGDGTADDQCQPCTTSGNCPNDYYYSDAACDGSSTSDDSCVLCTTEGNCASGSYFDSTACADGDGEIDSCVLCTTTGNCPDDYFFNVLNCQGTGNTDDSCELCTTVGNCDVGEYFDGSLCADGTGSVDSCVLCSTTCPTGFFYDNTQCQGDGTTDDTCIECSTVIDHCLECTTGEMCDVCETGYTPMTDDFLGVTLADGTVVSASNVYGHCIDIDAPALANCPPEVVIEADSIAQIYYAHWYAPDSSLPLTAIDVVDGELPFVCSPADSGDAVGIYGSPLPDFNVTCSATDAASNEAVCNFLVEVIDATPPVFNNCPSNIVVVVEYGSSTQSATWTEPTAEDDVDGAVQVYGSDTPGDEFPIGNNTVSYYAVDLTGNAAHCYFYVFVEFTATTTPVLSDVGFGSDDILSGVVENAVEDIVDSEVDAISIQTDNDSDGLGNIVSSTRSATSQIVLVFDSQCSDADPDANPDTSALGIVGGMIETILVDDLGLLADSITLSEGCAPVEIVTELQISFDGNPAGDPDYGTLEADIANEVAVTLEVTLAEVTIAERITSKILTLEVTSEERVSDDDLSTLISNINSNTDVNTYNIGPAASIIASEITVYNDMATDITILLDGTYDDVTDYSSLESALIDSVIDQLEINNADIVIQSGIGIAGELSLRVITPGYDDTIATYQFLNGLDAAATSAGFDGVSSVTRNNLVSTEVTVIFIDEQTDGGDYSALESEILSEVALTLGTDSSNVMLEESITNSRIVLLIYSIQTLSVTDSYAILTAINTNTDVANTDLTTGESIDMNELSATEADSRNELQFTVVSSNFVSEQISLEDLIESVNSNQVLSDYVNIDGTNIGSVRAGYLIEDTETWTTILGFSFDEAYVADEDYSTHEFMALQSIANILGISIYDIETVSIGDDGNGLLEIQFSFVTTFELTTIDVDNMIASFFAYGTDCLSNVTITDVLAGIEMLYAAETQLSAAQKQLCIVQYFSNLPTNTITQWQDDTGLVNYYAGTTRADWAITATESKVFQFMGSGNIVNNMQLGRLVGSDISSFSVTTVPEGQSYSALHKAYDTAITLERYVITAIELFNGVGAYLHEAVDVNFCITQQDESLSVSVYRLEIGGTEWTEVTELLKVSKYCYVATTPLCILAIGVTKNDLSSPQYAQALSASVLYGHIRTGSTPDANPVNFAGTLSLPYDEVHPQVYEYFTTQGNVIFPTNDCEYPYFGLECKKRGCPRALSPTANYFGSTIDLIFTPCLSGNNEVGCSHSYFECASAGVCDYDTGECTCNTGFSGAGCRYRDCIRNDDGVACSGHGQCTMVDFAVDSTQDTTSDRVFSTVSDEWDSHQTLQCVCDAGYDGPDCSLRRCPYGADPHAVCPREVAPDVQSVDVSSLSVDSSFILVFTDAQGTEWRTSAVPQNAAALQLQAALMALPNAVLPSVDVSKELNSEIFDITFTDDSTIGQQHLTQCNPQTALPVCWKNEEMGGNIPLFLYDGTCSVARTGLPETDPDNYVYQTVSECSNRGMCNGQTGLCECFEGFYSAACSIVAKTI
jgi:hypothetical protein